MTQQQLRDLIKASNPVSSPARLLPHDRDVQTLFEEVMHRTGNPQPSDDPLEQPVERRRDMQTREKPIQVVREPQPSRPRRRLVPALAGAMAVIVIAAGAWALTRTPNTDVAVGSPLEVTELFDEVIVTGNWAGAGVLYAADATWQLTTPDGDSPAFRFSDELPATAPVADWDGDGIVTEADDWASLGAEIYSAGTTDFLSCTQPDAVTATCQEIREGYAFKNPSHSATWTFTITDGLIDSIVVDLMGNGEDPSAAAQYRRWVEENRPELVDDLFDFSGQRIFNPDNVDTHRELVAEWVAQR